MHTRVPNSRSLTLTFALWYVGAMGLVGCSAPSGEPDPEGSAPKNAASAAPAISKAGEVLPGGEILKVIPPNGWVLQAGSNQGPFRRAEYVRDPNAEPLETLTLEAFSAEGQPDPLLFLDGIAAAESERCDDFKREPTFAGTERGVPTVVELHRCPRRPVNGKASLSLLKVIQGKGTYAVITLAKEGRAKSSPEGWVIDFVEEGDVARWALYLKNAYLEPAGDDQAPTAAEPL